VNRRAFLLAIPGAALAIKAAPTFVQSFALSSPPPAFITLGAKALGAGRVMVTVTGCDVAGRVLTYGRRIPDGGETVELPTAFVRVNSVSFYHVGGATEVATVSVVRGA
jgi:hypothetical protein